MIQARNIHMISSRGLFLAPFLRPVCRFCWILSCVGFCSCLLAALPSHPLVRGQTCHYPDMPLINSEPAMHSSTILILSRSSLQLISTWINFCGQSQDVVAAPELKFGSVRFKISKSYIQNLHRPDSILDLS